MAGWTTLTAEPTEMKQIDDLRKAARREFNVGDPSTSRVVTHNSLRQLRVFDAGYGTDPIMRFLDNNTDLWERAIVVECNDTTEAGDATAYEVVRGDQIRQIDSAIGRERRRGFDAADELAEYLDGEVYVRT